MIYYPEPQSHIRKKAKGTLEVIINNNKLVLLVLKSCY